MSQNYNADSYIPKALQKMGNGAIWAAVMQESALFSSGLLKKKKTKGRDVVINLKDRTASIEVIEDGGSITYSARNRKQLRVTGVTVVGAIKLGVNAVEQTQSKSEAADVLADELGCVAEEIGQDVNQMIIGEEMATVAANFASAQADVTINEFAALTPGRTYSVLNSSGALIENFTVQSVTNAADPDGPHTVTATANFGTGGTAGDTIVLKGILNDGTDIDKEFASMEKAAGTGDLYGQTVGAAYQYEGWSKTLSATFDIAELKLLESKRKNGSRCNLEFSIMNSFVEDSYIGSFFDSGAHYQPGGRQDVRAHTSSYFRNKPILLDETAGPRAFLVGKDAAYLAEFSTFHVTGMKGLNPPSSLAPFLAEGEHSYKFRVHGLYQMVWQKRRALAMMDSINYN